MSATRSRLPLPFSPWHMAQSYPYTFLARAWDSGVGFTGLTMRAASTGILDWAGVADGCCGKSKKGSSATRTNKGFNIRTTCIADGILCLREPRWEALSLRSQSRTLTEESAGGFGVELPGGSAIRQVNLIKPDP